MADSLFDNDNNSFDQNKNYLEELVGEGKKFKTVEDLARGKAEADHYITHKNKEFDELREDFLKVRAENVAKAKFEELLLTQQRGTDTNNRSENTHTDTVEQPVIDDKKIEEIAERKFADLQNKAREKANLDVVESRLRERFGENARSILKDKMNALNITDEDLKFLARKSPEAVFNTLGLNQQQETYQAPPRSSLRSDNFTSQTEIRDAIYYEKLRQSDPKKYFSEKTSVQRLKDMESPDFLMRYNQQRRA